MVAVLALAASLLIAPLSFDLSLKRLRGSPITVVSEGRNLTLSVRHGGLYAENTRIGGLEKNTSTTVSIECLTDASLHISLHSQFALFSSPSLCTSSKVLHIDESSLYGCITRVFQGSSLILNELCSDGDSKSSEESTNEEWQLTSPYEDKIAPPQPVYIAEPLQVNEGASMPLQWKNVYILPEHSRLNISNNEIIFSIIESPHHGILLLKGQPLASFTYADLLARSVLYKHDGSETREDHLDFQIEFPKKAQFDFPWIESTVYTLKVVINPVNDAPEISDATGGGFIKITASGSRVLNSDFLRLNDVDNSPDFVKVQVVETKGAHIIVQNKSVNEFTQRQFLNSEVRVVDEGISAHSTLRLIARDPEARSNVITLQLASVTVGVKLAANSGLKLLHHGAGIINAENLSFVATVPELTLHFRIVGQPEHGVVECSPPHGHFHVCSSFSQAQINAGLVRFRHTGNGTPLHDAFSFQVESGDFVSMVHTFRITFIPMNVKVFNREVFLLNGTERGVLTRSNLFAWVFPKSYSPSELLYHIIEPPKFGILSRKIGAKNRRIGVSSNFTQQDIDAGSISYKLHFMQYSVLNDYFLFKIITPAVHSETQRFEIVFLPSQASVQIVNRTIVVDEGLRAAITSSFLAVSTTDDKYFVFTIVVPPQHGTLQYQETSGSFKSLLASDNFTTAQINEGRLFYNHSGSESRSDRAFLLAEAAFRGGTRIPLWLTFSIILHNDNAPYLLGSSTIYMTEKSDRLIRPNMLDWTDADIDTIALKFTFNIGMKEAAVLSTTSPYRPISEFSTEDIQKDRVMIRHLGITANFSIPYTVSDGLHSVLGVLNVITREPFMEVHTAEFEYCCQPGDKPQIEVKPGNLNVRTNLDVPLSSIKYSTPSLHFVLKSNGTARSSSHFTQQDIQDGFLFYNVHTAQSEPIDVAIAERRVRTEIKITLKSPGASLELRHSQALSVTIAGAATLDNQTLLQNDGITPPAQLIFAILRSPSQGHLILDSSGSSFVSTFSQADIDSGKLQYLHTGKSPGRDSFTIEIRSPHATKGPYSIYIDIYDNHIELNTTSIALLSGSSTVISSANINVSSSDRFDYYIKVVSPPNSGWIVRDGWTLSNISAIDTFTGNELRERRIVYVSDRSANAAKDKFQIVACVTGSTCTAPQTVELIISQKNRQSPLLLRNEVLRVKSTNMAIITNSHLRTEDVDTSPNDVHFLISKPPTGHVAKTNNPFQPIYNFSQQDIDDGTIAFYKYDNITSNAGGGFSFLLSDGVHQVGPEWFTVETWDNQLDVELEANSRLLCAPDTNCMISADVLRANIHANSAQDIYFSVIRPPKFGKLLLDGAPCYKFSQQDVNRRLVSYLTTSENQSEWTQRESFTFSISTNTSTYKVNNIGEHRFRIISTYAVLSPEIIRKFVTTSILYVSKGGSTAFNETHIDAGALSRKASKEIILMEIAKEPRHGEIEWVDLHRSVIPWVDFLKGWPLIYHHLGDPDHSDDLVFYVYPASESTRSSSRLRVILPISILPLRDPQLHVEKFPRSLPCVSGAAASLDQTTFYAHHPIVPPQSIIYQVIQQGRNGARIRVSHRNRDLFSQEELNQGLVSIVHTPPATGAFPSDIIVFSVEGNYRSLIVKIRPLDLALENHTTIYYPQGKTYVVLNRSHLGAFSNGDRTKITYRIVDPPENGTFYWVAGEKEAKEFTQDDIDKGRILYAQLNMHSYKDSFEFVVVNTGRDTVRNRSAIIVQSLVVAQPVIVEANTTTPITTSQLNASALEGSTPRFLVASPPKFGRITVDLESAHSAHFFTFSDVAKGKVHYQSFGNRDEVTENLELEVRADSVQPARVILPITILPSDEIDAEQKIGTEFGISPNSENNTEDASEGTFPRLVKSDYILHISLLACIVLIAIIIMICRFNSNDKKTENEKILKLDEAGDSRRLTTPRRSSEKPDLLGSTVFATIKRSEAQKLLREMTPPRSPMKTFEPTKRSTTMRKNTLTRGHVASLDYAGLTGDNPPPMPLFQQLSRPVGDSQHWV